MTDATLSASPAAAAPCVRRPGGRLIFTVEAPAGDETAGDGLHGHGRYSHPRRDLEPGLRAASPVPVELQRVVLRREAGRPVDGQRVSALAGSDG